LDFVPVEKLNFSMESWKPDCVFSPFMRALKKFTNLKIKMINLPKTKA
jgi:hypothetical protein